MTTDLTNIITIDFETFPIEDRPRYPPEPVGVSIKYGREPSRYYAWGHVAGKNNCDRLEAEEELRRALDLTHFGTAKLLFHNAKFDVAILEEKFGFGRLPWDSVHDTTFLAFLADPHSKSAGLKQLAEHLLDWPPEERDAIGDWVWDHRTQLFEATGKRPSRSQGKTTRVGEWIAYAPGDLVGTYAESDTDKTFALFELLYPLIVENGMLEAYDRERRVLPIFMENERIGLRIDLEGLNRDIPLYEKARERADAWLRERLGAPELNVDSDDDVAAALAQAGVIDDDKWTLTKTGKRSVSKVNLRPEMYNDPAVASAFGYRNRLGTCLTMFMEPWRAQAAQRGGYVSTNWNQIRGGDSGTRTGRPSTSNPNFLNISKTFADRSDGYAHPDHLDVPELPKVRVYILPDEGHLFLHRDFDGQELRIYADLEQGDLYNRYCADPAMKPHDYIKDRVEEMTGEVFDKTVVKNINFGKIYGAGVPRIAELLKSTLSAAREFNAVHARAMPDLKIVNEEIKRVAMSGEAIRTWGGRMYYPEPPMMIDGRRVDFMYKLLNYRVQGSAADVTKEALIRWYNHPDRYPTDRFLVTVYDEINLSAHKSRWKEAMRVLRECMEGIEMDVPMLSSPKVGASWGTCAKVEE